MFTFYDIPSNFILMSFQFLVHWYQQHLKVVCSVSTECSVVFCIQKKCPSLSFKHNGPNTGKVSSKTCCEWWKMIFIFYLFVSKIHDLMYIIYQYPFSLHRKSKCQACFQFFPLILDSTNIKMSKSMYFGDNWWWPSI